MKEKTSRVLAAVNGKDADRVPFAAWMHLATQHLEPAVTAQLHERFFRFYDLDLMKVMNDYPYPQPGGVEEVNGLDAMQKFTPLEATAFDQQLQVIASLRAQLGPDVIILDTVFNPYGVAQVLLKQSLELIRQSQPEAFAQFLESIAASLHQYLKASLEAGASGVFYSVNGARASYLSDDELEHYVLGLDLRVLAAAKGALLNVCHAHGDEPRLERLQDYPVHAYSWSQLTITPTIAEFRGYSDKCVMGGINEQLTILRRQPSQIREDVLQTVEEAGRNRVIIAPGCSLAPETPVRLIRAARAAVDDISLY